MKIIQLSLNCNIVLTILTLILLIYVLFYKPKLSLKSQEILMNL